MPAEQERPYDAAHIDRRASVVVASAGSAEAHQGLVGMRSNTSAFLTGGMPVRHVVDQLCDRRDADRIAGGSTESFASAARLDDRSLACGKPGAKAFEIDLRRDREDFLPLRGERVDVDETGEGKGTGPRRFEK